MRVLQIVEAASAGVGRHVLDLVRGLRERQCDVHLLYSPVRIDSTFSSGLEELKGLPRMPVDMKRGPHISDAAVLRQVKNYMRETGPFDIIHGQSSKGGAIARLAGLQDNAKVVYTPHCIFTMNPTLGKAAFTVFRSIELLLAKCTDAVIAVSPDESDHLLDIGFERDQVRCIPNGLIPPAWVDRGSIRGQLGLNESDVLLGFLGRMSEQKNPLLMVQAFARLASKFPQVYLAMVGDGPLHADAMRLADELDCAQRIFWLGYKKPEEVLAGLDIFALTSRYEGLPYVLLEALYAGLPIVSTRVGGATLAIDTGVNGSIVPSLQAADFAAAVEPLVADGEHRRRMADASVKKAEEFAVDKMVKRILDMYSELQ